MVLGYHVDRFGLWEVVALAVEGIHSCTVDWTSWRKVLGHSGRAIGAVMHLLERVAGVTSCLLHHILLVDLLWVLLAQQERSFVNTALSPNDWVDSPTKNRELNSVLNQVRSLRHFKELGILEPLSELADKSPLDLILSLCSLIMSIFSYNVGLWLDLTRGVSIAIHQEVRLLFLLLLVLLLRPRVQLLLKLLISLHLSHSLHECDTVCEYVSCFTCFCDVLKIFVKLGKVLS